MPLTRDFKETIQDRVQRDPAFREELVVISPRSHPGIRRARDVRADTVVSFPEGAGLNSIAARREDVTLPFFVRSLTGQKGVLSKSISRSRRFCGHPCP